jgi:hypothetical protein
LGHALQEALRTVPLAALEGPYRAVNYDHLMGRPPGTPSRAPAQPLWSRGAARHGARFTPKDLTDTALHPVLGTSHMNSPERGHFRNRPTSRASARYRPRSSSARRRFASGGSPAFAIPPQKSSAGMRVAVFPNWCPNGISCGCSIPRNAAAITATEPLAARVPNGLKAPSLRSLLRFHF